MSDLSHRLTHSEAKAVAKIPTAEGRAPKSTVDPVEYAESVAKVGREFAPAALSPALLEELAKTLRENGIDEHAPSNLHSWRCEHKNRYGQCTCFDMLMNDLTPILSRALAEATEQMRELLYMDVRALPGYVDHTKGTSGFEIGDNSRVDVLRTIRATTNPYLTEKEN